MQNFYQNQKMSKILPKILVCLIVLDMFSYNFFYTVSISVEAQEIPAENQVQDEPEATKDETSSDDSKEPVEENLDDKETKSDVPEIVTEEAQETNKDDPATKDVEQPKVCLDNESCIKTDIENNNDAQVENKNEAVTDTGDNKILTEEENTTIDDQENQLEDNAKEESSVVSETDKSEEVEVTTGEAQASSTVVNEINTNIISDNYAELITNIDGQYVGDINFLEIFQKLLENSGDAQAQNLIIENFNKANVANNISAVANTGSNEISVKGKISTGDALAQGEVVNLINTNLVGNNWFFSMVNVFGDWVGNLILPGEGLLSVPGNFSAQTLNVQNENDAKIENVISANANTGGNEISGKGIIVTGDAISQAQTQTIANTNIIRNNWFQIFINNQGVWTGKIFGWDGLGNGNFYTYDFATNDEQAEKLNSYLSVHNQNTANISNYVDVKANTGNNAIEGAGKINTGIAWANANVFNLVNTNIVGNNWMFGIVNVMGRWDGNAIFAFPDLSVSIGADKEKITTEENLSYKILLKNNGQAKSQNVHVSLSLPSYVTTQGNSNWNLSELAPGETKEFSVSAKLAESAPKDVSTFQAIAEAKTDTEEKELGNNQSSISTGIILAKNENDLQILDEEALVVKNSLSISRSIGAGEPFRPGDTITHLIAVKNETGGTIHDLKVAEKVYDPNGKQIGEASWPIEKLKRGQKVLIQYQVSIDQDATIGTYKNTASAVSYDESGNTIKGEKKSISYQIIPAISNLSGDSAGGEENTQTLQANEYSEIGETMASKIPNEKSSWFWLWILAFFSMILFLSRRKFVPAWNKAVKFGQSFKNSISNLFL